MVINKSSEYIRKLSPEDQAMFAKASKQFRSHSEILLRQTSTPLRESLQKRGPFNQADADTLDGRTFLIEYGRDSKLISSLNSEKTR